LQANNWWQIKRVLEEQGWKEILTYEDRILYFRKGEATVGYEKSNNMTVPYTVTLLRRVDIDYESFLASYNHDNTKK
jgi:hypothetical protein